SRALALLAERTMRLQVTIQEGHIFVADGATSVPVDLRVLKPFGPG
ncbi:MAG TPA: YaeQ family protein, partial [Casimicrobiaceae bacterium]|nr:YaeQ family protein [Casimicrobiaceae bacterium]